MSRIGTAVLLRALQNPTKVKVLVLLSDYEKMTVTQMAGLVKVSRPNLYHVVSEMVSEGLLSGPESKVKGNYVEKYYSLSKKAIEGESEDEWRATVRGASPEALRDMMHSLLVSVSMQCRIIAEQLANADPRALSRLAEARDQSLLLGTYGILPDDEYADLTKKIRDLIAKHGEHYKGPRKRGKNKMFLFAIPDLSSGDTRKSKSSSAP